MIPTLNFYYPSIEGGGLEKNLFSLINSLAKKNIKLILLLMKIIQKKKNLKKNFILIRI